MRLAATDRKALLHGQFHIVNKGEHLSSTNRVGLARVFHQDALEIADPGQPYQATDVVSGKMLPGRRLIFAAENSHYCIVHYERGGIAYSCQIVVFKIVKSKAHLVWSALAPGRLAGLAEFRRALTAGRLDDRGANATW